MENKTPLSLVFADVVSWPDYVKGVPPLSYDNAGTLCSFFAFDQAKRTKDLRPLVELARMALSPQLTPDILINEARKAISLFEEACFSKKEHWLAEAVYELADATSDLFEEILRVCPFFHYRVLQRELRRNRKWREQTAKEMEEKLKAGVKRGAEKTNRQYKKIAERCVQIASETWKDRPTLRITHVCEVIEATLNSEGALCPTVETIKGYLKAAEKEGILDTPPQAHSKGRPKKPCIR